MTTRATTRKHRKTSPDSLTTMIHKLTDILDAVVAKQAAEQKRVDDVFSLLHLLNASLTAARDEHNALDREHKALDFEFRSLQDDVQAHLGDGWNRGSDDNEDDEPASQPFRAPHPGGPISPRMQRDKLLQLGKQFHLSTPEVHSLINWWLDCLDGDMTERDAFRALCSIWEAGRKHS